MALRLSRVPRPYIAPVTCLCAISIFRLAVWVLMIGCAMGDISRRRRRSMRLAGWDYREAGAYFVTMCTLNRECILDDPIIRRALQMEWARAICGGSQPEPHDFVVMPNHVHGIVWITGSAERRARHSRVQAGGEGAAQSGQPSSVDPKGASPLRTAGCAPGSLGAKVGAFKSAAAAQPLHLPQASPPPPALAARVRPRIRGGRRRARRRRTARRPGRSGR